MFNRNKPKAPAITTLVGADTSVQGDLEFSGGCLIDGCVYGSVRAVDDTEATLRVSERGRIEGTVDVPIVILNGTVNGDVKAETRVELGAKSRVVGNVTYALIEMAIGSEVHGNLLHAGTVSGDEGVAGERNVAEPSVESSAITAAKLLGES